MQRDNNTGGRSLAVDPPDPRRQCLDDLIAAGIALSHAAQLAEGFKELELTKLRWEISDARTIVQQASARLVSLPLPLFDSVVRQVRG